MFLQLSGIAGRHVRAVPGLNWPLFRPAQLRREKPSMAVGRSRLRGVKSLTLRGPLKQLFSARLVAERAGEPTLAQATRLGQDQITAIQSQAASLRKSAGSSPRGIQDLSILNVRLNVMSFQVSPAKPGALLCEPLGSQAERAYRRTTCSTSTGRWWSSAPRQRPRSSSR